jgi:hypothetical protein
MYLSREERCSMTKRLSFWDSRINADKLGAFVYALVDPRNSEVFYVGKGGGKFGGGNERPDHHLAAAERAIHDDSNPTAKDRRIIEIWGSELQPQLVIVRRLLSVEAAFELEAALIDILANYGSGTLTNRVRGHNVDMGILTESNWHKLAADPVNPSDAIEGVWMFNIAKLLSERSSDYEAVRGYWSIKLPKDKGYAVGLASGISKIVCRIDGWKKSDQQKSCFDGEVLDEHDNIGKQLLRRDFRIVTSAAGKWLRGSPIRADFDGKGNFTVTYNGDREPRRLSVD